MLLTNFSAQDAYAVTPSDTVDLPNGVCKGIYIGDAAAANVKVMMQGGESVTFANVIPGQVLPIAAKRVYSTSTTATDIIALY